MTKKLLLRSANEAEPKPDWTQVLFEVIIKILTLGFYHIEKHKNR